MLNVLHDTVMTRNLLTYIINKIINMLYCGLAAY